MQGVYIQNCKSFADAMNNLNFEVRIPEYYVTNIPSYFTRGPKRPNPIVNGVEVSWEEFKEKNPDYEEDDNYFTPTTIYKGTEMNMCLSFKTPTEIVDILDNEVPLSIPDVYSIYCIMNIMDGYISEVGEFEAFHADLKYFLSKLRKARTIFNNRYQQELTYYYNTHPSEKQPMTLIDVLNMIARK